MVKMKPIDWIAIVLLIIGGLNWGLVGLFNFNLVSWIANTTFSFLENLIYIIVGIASGYSIWSLFIKK